MTKPYIELDCPNYDEINAGILDYLENRTPILQYDPDVKRPYANFVNTIDFLKHNPKLSKYFSSLGIFLYHVYFAVAFHPTDKHLKNPFSNFANPGESNSVPIHLDRPPVQWKMNWPVLNMINTGTRFYQLKDPTDTVAQYLSRAGVPGSLARDTYYLPYEPFEESHRHIFGLPILMNGLIAHDVWFCDTVPMPRIGLQMMFVKEPRHLLDNDCVILDQDYVKKLEFIGV
jgi:hypothetical protein